MAPKVLAQMEGLGALWASFNFQFYHTFYHTFTTNHYHYTCPNTMFSVPKRNMGKVLRGLQRFGENLAGTAVTLTLQI